MEKSLRKQPTILMGEQRNSGATLYPAVYKMAPGMHLFDQMRKMQRYSDVFCPILAWRCTRDVSGYVMPMLQPLETEEHVEGALGRLQRLWILPGGDEGCSRKDYQEYVRSLPCDSYLQSSLEAWWSATRSQEGSSAFTVHGDATLENAMRLGDVIYWLDPNPRVVPLERELDCGKLLQSRYGYHGALSDETIKTIDGFVNLRNSPMLAYYYLITHLIRLWRYQPGKRDWAVAVAKEVRSRA